MMVRAAGDRLTAPLAGYDPGFTDIKTWSAEDRALVAMAKFNGLIQGTGPTPRLLPVPGHQRSGGPDP